MAVTNVGFWRFSGKGRPLEKRGCSQILADSPYYRDMPPPPPGYRFGYYDGYVVAYNPTTQIVADVLDLVGAAINH